MKTLTLRIKTLDENLEIIKNDSRIYSSIVRYSLERCYEDKTSTKIYQDVVTKFKLNSHLINCAIRESRGIYNRLSTEDKKNKKKFVFGQFKKLVKGLITKEEYLKKKNCGLYSEGEACKSGNRMFSLDLENNKIIYKKAKGHHIELDIVEKLSPNRIKILEQVYLSMIEKVGAISFRIKEDKVYIIYNEKEIEKYKQFKNLDKNRILGIDLNPNYIGISILKFNSNDSFDILYKECIDISELNEKGSTNKVKFELQQIDNHILKLCKQYKVNKLVVEDLKFKKNNKFWSKNLNRLCKNKFRYSTIKSHLNTLCNTYGVKFIEVNAVYSSVIGNFVYGSEECPDMISASIEIARRGFKKFQKEWFYPSMVTLDRIKEVLGNHWNDLISQIEEELELNFNSWKELYNQIKKSGLKYRFQLDGSMAVLSKNYYKRKVILYNFR